MEKTIAHQSMSVDKMYETLLSKDTVECNSPKNRKRLYARLKKENIKFIREIIGYTSGSKSLLHWLNNKIYFNKFYYNIFYFTG